MGQDGEGRRAIVRARLGLVGFVGGLALCLAVSLSRDPNPPLVPPPGATCDLDFYRQVVARVHQGEAYHDAAHAELLEHGYPSRSVYNWRTPVYAWLLGRVLGLEWGRLVLMIGVLTAVVMACRDVLEDCGLISASLSGVMIVGATAWSLGGETFLFMELWAGMLILISIGAYRRGLTGVAVAAGLFALFFRELALPYALVSLGIAAWHGRRREATAWIVGLLLYVAFMGYHTYEVHARLTPADQALVGGWVRFGGIRFLLTTAQANVFLMALPMWCTGVYLPFAVAGLAGMRGEAQRRVSLTAGLYLVAFAVVGNPFNFYWGFINAPLMAIALAYAPATLKNLVDAAFPARLSMTPAFTSAEARA